jgi:glycosyltransferase involved in cell wall biosynthesis
VIPAYRQAKYLNACLDSVAAQNYSGLSQVIVVDDGSDDGSADLAAAHSLQPTVIRQQNTGVSGARNRGIQESTGEFIAFLDADDRWHDGKLEAQIKALVSTGQPALSFTRYRRVDPSGSLVPLAADHPSTSLKPSPRHLIRQNFIGTSTVVVHRDCLERCGGFPVSHGLLAAGQDFALWLRIAAHFPLVYVPEVLTDYTVHPTNRVGIDPLKHHQGGVNALRSLQEWAPTEFSEMSGGVPLELILAGRRAKLVRDLIWRRREYPAGSLGRLIAAFAKGEC